MPQRYCFFVIYAREVLFFLKKILAFRKKAVSLQPFFDGKLSEWSKEPHSKCGVRITLYRGFESLTFRLKENGRANLVLPFFF